MEGVQSFMKFVKDNLGANCRVRCPCIDCLNSYVWSQDVVFDHLLIKGIDGFYTRWIFHGEKSNYNVRAKPLQKTVDLATDFSGGFYPLQFNDGLAMVTNLATDLPTDNIPSPK